MSIIVAGTYSMFIFFVGWRLYQGERSEATRLWSDSCSADTNVYTPQVAGVKAYEKL